MVEVDQLSSVSEIVVWLWETREMVVVVVVVVVVIIPYSS
jgi:hypothetical protein